MTPPRFSRDGLFKAMRRVVAEQELTAEDGDVIHAAIERVWEYPAASNVSDEHDAARRVASILLHLLERGLSSRLASTAALVVAMRWAPDAPPATLLAGLYRATEVAVTATADPSINRRDLHTALVAEVYAGINPVAPLDD